MLPRMTAKARSARGSVVRGLLSLPGLLPGFPRVYKPLRHVHELRIQNLAIGVFAKFIVPQRSESELTLVPRLLFVCRNERPLFKKGAETDFSVCHIGET